MVAIDILSVEAVGGDRRNISPPLQTPGEALRGLVKGLCLLLWQFGDDTQDFIGI